MNANANSQAADEFAEAVDDLVEATFGGARFSASQLESLPPEQRLSILLFMCGSFVRWASESSEDTVWS